MTLTTEQIENICKLKQGKDCCRYLVCGTNGFECAKLGPLKGVIDGKVQYMVAQADNCEGVR